MYIYYENKREVLKLVTTIYYSSQEKQMQVNFIFNFCNLEKIVFDKIKFY